MPDVLFEARNVGCLLLKLLLLVVQVRVQAVYVLVVLVNPLLNPLYAAFNLAYLVGDLPLVLLELFRKFLFTVLFGT